MSENRLERASRPVSRVRPANSGSRVFATARLLRRAQGDGATRGQAGQHGLQAELEVGLGGLRRAALGLLAERPTHGVAGERGKHAARLDGGEAFTLQAADHGCEAEARALAG